MGKFPLFLGVQEELPDFSIPVFRSSGNWHFFLLAGANPAGVSR
jgi:hypothetical protein